MYSAEVVNQRFRVINGNNANHFVAVRFHDHNWEYTNSDTEGWLRFTPQLGDILVAKVDYGLDLVTMLEGRHDVIGGIIAGYIGGNLEISANRWNGLINRGEFYLTGNYISTHCPPDVERLEVIGYRGLTGDDSGDKDSRLSRPPSQTRIDKIDQPDFANRISLAEFDSGLPSYYYNDALTNSGVFGSAILPSGRSVIGQLAGNHVNQSLVGNSLLSENQQRRDLTFESIKTDQLDDFSVEWLDELVAI